MLNTIVASFASLVLAMPAAAQCPGDVDQDGIVNSDDLAAVLGGWGTDGQGAFDTDINNDGTVDGIDLSTLLLAWGPCPIVPAWATLIEATPDAAVIYDADLRAAIVATGLAWRVRDTATQMEMLLIPPGTFQMGEVAWAFPVHQVTLTNAFYMGRYEVTQAQWQATMGNNPSYFSSAADSPSRPVEQVSWNTIQGFLTATGMRLPTEAEWEYACRGGTTTVYHGWPANPAGSNISSSVGTIAWHNGNNNPFGTKSVGQKSANGFGLHDMSGNVWEFVNDWAVYQYPSGDPETDPQGPSSGTQRVRRGGGWVEDSGYVRSSTRNGRPPDVSGYYDGFRAARTP
jgi:formylglycine-generating enzyme required for sulfatase activity